MQVEDFHLFSREGWCEMRLSEPPGKPLPERSEGRG